MQTDQDEQQSQGDGLNETEENTPEENEEMQVNRPKLIDGFSYTFIDVKFHIESCPDSECPF